MTTTTLTPAEKRALDELTASFPSTTWQSSVDGFLASEAGLAACLALEARGLIEWRILYYDGTGGDPRAIRTIGRTEWTVDLLRHLQPLGCRGAEWSVTALGRVASYAI